MGDLTGRELIDQEINKQVMEIFIKMGPICVENVKLFFAECKKLFSTDEKYKNAEKIIDQLALVNNKEIIQLFLLLNIACPSQEGGDVYLMDFFNDFLEEKMLKLSFGASSATVAVRSSSNVKRFGDFPIEILNNIGDYLGVENVGEVHAALEGRVKQCYHFSGFRSFKNNFSKDRPGNPIYVINGYLGKIIKTRLKIERLDAFTHWKPGEPPSSTGVWLLDYFNKFGNQFEPRGQLELKILEIATNKMQDVLLDGGAFNIIKWLFYGAKKLDSGCLLTMITMVAHMSEDPSLPFVLKHEERNVFTIIRAMLLGVIDASRCIQIKDTLLKQLLYCAFQVEGYNISAKFGCLFPLEVITNLLLFKESWKNVEPAAYGNESSMTLSSGYNMAADGSITAAEGLSDATYQLPKMSVSEIKYFLELSWGNLRLHMDAMFDILAKCESRQEQNAFIFEVTSMLSTAETASKRLRQQLISSRAAAQDVSLLSDPAQLILGFSQAQYQEFAQLLDSWKNRLEAPVRRPRL
jgi:hypothetical protein